MKKTVKYVGMDVHKKTIDIAIADEGRDTEVRHYGTIKNDTDSINKFLWLLMILSNIALIARKYWIF